MSILTTRKKDGAGRSVPAEDRVQVTIDFPRQGEVVAPGHYAVRVSSGASRGVEISVDGGPWQSCRPSVGFHWFDWNASPAGKHTLVARVGSGFRAPKSPTRVCKVG